MSGTPPGVEQCDEPLSRGREALQEEQDVDCRITAGAEADQGLQGAEGDEVVCSGGRDAEYGGPENREVEGRSEWFSIWPS